MTCNTLFSKKYFVLESLDRVERLYRPRGLVSAYEIWWLKKGQGSLIIDSQQLPLCGDTIYCFPPGHSVTIPDLKCVEGYCISLSADVILGSCNYNADSIWANAFFIDGSFLVLSGVDNISDELQVIFGYLQREMLRQGNTQFEVLAGLLNLMGIYLSHKMTESGQAFHPSREFSLVQRFRNLVRQDFVKKKLVSDYADDLRITPTHLNRIVRKLVGKTASAIIHEQIILAAKRLAMESGSSMKETAYALGFEDHYHFSRFFRTHCGVCFSDYRNGVGIKEQVTTIAP